MYELSITDPDLVQRIKKIAIRFCALSLAMRDN